MRPSRYARELRRRQFGIDLSEDKDEDWQRVLLTNLTSTHWGCQIFGGHMAKAGGGSILNIGSVSAHLPLSRVFAYSASKAAVVNLTKNVAREFAPHKVRVNVFAPAFSRPSRTARFLDPQRVDNHSAANADGPLRRTERIGRRDAVAFVRNAGSFITGAAIYVDGGFTAMRSEDSMLSCLTPLSSSARRAISPAAS